MPTTKKKKTPNETPAWITDANERKLTQAEKLHAQADTHDEQVEHLNAELAKLRTKREELGGDLSTPGVELVGLDLDITRHQARATQHFDASYRLRRAADKASAELLEDTRVADVVARQLRDHLGTEAVYVCLDHDVQPPEDVTERLVLVSPNSEVQAAQLKGTRPMMRHEDIERLGIQVQAVYPSGNGGYDMEYAMPSNTRLRGSVRLRAWRPAEPEMLTMEALRAAGFIDPGTGPFDDDRERRRRFEVEMSAGKVQTYQTTSVTCEVEAVEPERVEATDDEARAASSAQAATNTPKLEKLAPHIDSVFGGAK